MQSLIHRVLYSKLLVLAAESNINKKQAKGIVIV